jgi:uncharacterized metal-binding protein YceD (DUF177 family)
VVAVDIRNLKSGESARFEEIIPLETPPAYGVAGGRADVSVSGKIFRHGTDFTVMADCSARISLLCARCLEPVELPFAFGLNERFSEKRDADAGGDIWPLTDKSIDVTPALESAFYSLIPSRAVCSESCEGFVGALSGGMV